MILKTLTSGLAMAILFSSSAMAEGENNESSTQDLPMITENGDAAAEKLIVSSDTMASDTVMTKTGLAGVSKEKKKALLAATGLAFTLWVLTQDDDDKVSGDTPTSP